MWSHFLRNSKISHFLEINFHNEIIYPRKVDKEAMCMLVVISLLALAGAYGVLYLTAYVPVSFFWGQYHYEILYLYGSVLTVSPEYRRQNESRYVYSIYS